MNRKKQKRARRKHRRNPSSAHPILAALATILVEGVTGAILVNIVKANTPARHALITTATAIAGYFIGKHYFPRSKMAILVGSVIQLALTEGGVAIRAINARGGELPTAPAAPQVSG